jgi:hypothetical protein
MKTPVSATCVSGGTAALTFSENYFEVYTFKNFAFSAFLKDYNMPQQIRGKVINVRHI